MIPVIKEELEDLKKLLAKKATREEIMCKFNWSEQQFDWRMNKFFPEIDIKKTSKRVNHRYFENINNGKKAYLLGFFIADGCLMSQKKDKTLNHFIITLKREDEIILNFFKKEICPDATLQQGHGENNYQTSKIQWTSENMAKDILKYITTAHRKSYDSILDINLELIPDRYFGDLLRGLMDGDGTIKLGFPKIEVLFSSEIFANKIKEKLNNLVPLVNVTITKDEFYSKKDNTKRNVPMHRLFINSRLGHSDNFLQRYLAIAYYVSVFYSLLYFKNSNFYLPRKKKRFTEYRANFLNNE